MESKFFAFINRMKYIKRWSLMHSVTEENIMEHSQQVAVISHALALIANKIYGKDVNVEKTVLIAQYHEVGEVITGDLPTPIKYFNEELNHAYKDLEKIACKKLLNMLPDELKGEYTELILPKTDAVETKIVKAADRLGAYIKCIEEIKSGNSEFKKAKTTIEKSIRALKMEEVDYFLENMIPSFNKTLDELD